MGGLESGEGDNPVFQIIGEEFPGGGLFEQPLRRKNAAEHLVPHVLRSKQTQRHEMLISRVRIKVEFYLPSVQPLANSAAKVAAAERSMKSWSRSLATAASSRPQT